MFTGLIEDVGIVVSLSQTGSSGRLTLSTSINCQEICIGDSIAVNGICLTVTNIDSVDQLSFDASPETLSCTNLGSLKKGNKVNLERALQLGNRLGGHIVSGHIDCTARLISVEELHGGNKILSFSIPEEKVRYLIKKGSVAIDGVSLTVNYVTRNSFSVNIIPHTGSATTITTFCTGQIVNIETDIIGKYVESLTAPWKPTGGLTMKTLAENGFI